MRRLPATGRDDLDRALFCLRWIVHASYTTIHGLLGGWVGLCIAVRRHKDDSCFSMPPPSHVTGLGRAPPKVINIEYDPRDVEAFIKVADAIEEAFPKVKSISVGWMEVSSHSLAHRPTAKLKVIVNGNEEQDGRPGSFEVSTEDGMGLFSRLSVDKNALPTPQDIIDRIVNRARGLTGSTDDKDKPFCG